MLEMWALRRKCAGDDLTKADMNGNSLAACLYSIMNWSCAFIVSTVTNKKPANVSLTKVKQFQGSSSFVKRSQWTLDQLRQVNGIDPNKVMTLPVPFDHCSSVCAVHLSTTVLAHIRSSMVFSSRTVQSSTWCLKMRLTSGALVQLERSAPSSRFSTTPASATARRGNPSSSIASPSWWEVRLSLHFKPARDCTLPDQNGVFLQSCCVFRPVAVSWTQVSWCRTYLWYVPGWLLKYFPAINNNQQQEL